MGKLIFINAPALEKISVMVHLYLTFKKGLQVPNIKMTPIKESIRLSIPHRGKINVLITPNCNHKSSTSCYKASAQKE
jgi:hypothetical protein